MSTQSPHPPTPKGPRNGNNNQNHNHNHNQNQNQNQNSNRRSSKKNTNTTPHAQKVAMLSTPPSSPPRNVSPGVATDPSANLHSKKKPPRSVKKVPNGNRTSPAPNGGNGHQRQTSQSANTPAKDAAYAGPTFHASPAPSALPMPSFFSKSYPESDLPTTFETDSEENEPSSETTPSKPRAARPQPQQQSQPQPQSQPAAQHKPSPLDFLFEAAKRAQNPDSNRLSSPEAAARVRSPQTDSKTLNANTTPGGGMFAFEMGSPERAQIGPSFAPSYQERMTALRASSSPSHTQSQPALNNMDDQRRMKTEELKHLLLNPRPQKPPSSLSPPQDKQDYGPRPNINANVPHYATPMRTTSGPPSTMSHGPSQPPLTSGNYPYAPHLNGSQNFRNTNSPLRRELPHHSAGSSPAPYGHYYNAPVPPHGNYISPQPQYTNAAFPMPTQSPSPTKSMETKQIEDDLRRVLKIGGPGIPTSGMQSPFAA